MFTRILVAYDGSEGAEAALALGLDLARHAQVPLTSVSVEEHLPRYAASISEVAGTKEQIDEHFRALTARARATAAAQGVALDTLVRQGSDVDEILDVARARRTDLLVLGSHGHRRLVARLIGSTSLAVTRVAPCSSLVVRPARRARLRLADVRRILVGLDGSALGRLALRTAIELARLAEASILGLTVRETPPLLREEPPDALRASLLGAAAAEQAAAAGVALEHRIPEGHAARALCETARRDGVDLVVLGATGLEHPWSTTLGGTASRVLGEAPCSVLLVRFPQGALHVRDVMARPVTAVGEATPLAEVVELLLRRNVKALPVTDAGGRVVGIITGGDLLGRGRLPLRLGIQQELDAATLGEQLRALAGSASAARDVMSRHVRTIDADESLAAAIGQMARHRVKRLPVVDAGGRLIGLVSRADVLRAIAALPEAPSPAERPLPGAARTVGDALVSDVPVVAPDAPAEQVLARVLEGPLRRVVVAGGDGRVLGLVGDRDLLARSGTDTRSWVLRMLRGEPATGGRAAPARRAGGLTASDLMVAPPLTVQPGDSLAHAIRLMVQHQVKRLIVVDGEGRLLGLVDRREILRLLAGDVAP